MPPRRGTVIDPELAAEQAAEHDQRAIERAAGDLLAMATADNEWKWHVHRLKSADEQARNPRGKPRVYVTTIHGPVDLPDFHQRFGGGVYEFWGFQNGTLEVKTIQELEGEPRPPQFPIATPMVSTAPTSHRGRRLERILARMMRDQEQRFQLLVTQLQARPPEAPRDTIGELVKAMAGIHAISRSSTPQPTGDAEFLKASMDMFRQGLEVGQTREPTTTPEGTDWVRVAELVVPAIGNVVSAIERKRAVQAARGRPGGAPPPPREPSEAEVVTDPPPAAAPPAGLSHRWLTAIESLADAIAEGDDPADFASLLSSILSRQEYALLRMAKLEHVIERLEPAFDQLPVLNTPAARDFVAAMLESVKQEEPAVAETVE